MNKAAVLETTTRILAVALACVIPLSNSLTTAISILLAICCLLSMDQQKLLSTVKHPVSIAIFILLGLYLLGALYSVGSGTEIKLALRKIGRLIYIPLLLPFFYDWRWRRGVMLAYLLAIFVTVLAALYIHTPVFKDGIFTSLFVAYGLFVLAHYALDYPRYRAIIIALMLLFGYYLLFVSIGRTGQVLFFILYVVFCWQRFAKAIKFQLIAAALLLGVVAASLLLPSSFAARYNVAAQEVQGYLHRDEAELPVTSSVGMRLTLVRNAIELIKLKPIFGWGTGAFTQAYLDHTPEGQLKKLIRNNPHDQYLLTWVELGLIGLVSLLYLFVRLGREFWCTQERDAQLGFGLMCAFALGCIANSWLLDYSSMYFFVVFAGVLAGATVRSAAAIPIYSKINLSCKTIDEIV